MSKAITNYEAAEMATETMKGVNNPRVWALCFWAFKAGMTEDEVNETLNNLRNDKSLSAVSMIVEFTEKATNKV